MKQLIWVALGALALSGCTGSRLAKLPVCSGKHRRPANPYGSILPALPMPQLPSLTPALPQSMAGEVGPGTAPRATGKAAPPPDPAPKTSAADVAASYRSC